MRITTGLQVIFSIMATLGSVNAQSLSQDQVDTAMNIPLIRNSCGPNIDTELWTDKIIGKDKALYFLALTAYLNPEAKSTDGRLVRNRVAEHLRSIITEDSSGKSSEPSCRGDLTGWKDIGQVFAIVLARRMPGIWSQFSAEEKNKFDWLMRAFAVSGNYHSNIRNWPNLCIYQTYRIGKTWNPNHNDGYVGVMIAVWYYFGGADSVNKILASFKYDDYILKFRQLHFHNIEETWTAAGTKKWPEGKDELFMKNLLEDPAGGVQYDKAEGKVFGARMPFIFGAPPEAEEKIPFDPVELYRAIGRWMYPHIVTNSSRSGAAYTLNNGSSPMLGKLGMCREFQVTDGFVPNVRERSDARYSWWGWMMHIPIVSAMMAINGWPENGELSETESRMYVGSEDLIYKLHTGYHSYSLGNEKEYFDYQFEDQGYMFILDIWNNYIKSRIKKPEIPEPVFDYNFTTLSPQSNAVIDGNARILARNGRAGLNTTSMHSQIRLSKHNINSNKGSLAIWVMSLEDIAPAWSAVYFGTDNKYFNIFPLLADKKDMGNFAAANFSFHINKIWHPGLSIKFKQGTGHDMYNHAAAAANHSDFEKLRWYQLTAIWDLQQKNIAIFINGIKVGSQDVTAEKLERDICGDTLFLGNPTLCISNVKFFNDPLSSQEVYTLYRKEATDYDSEYERKLKHIYTGTERKEFTFSPDGEWENKFNLTLTKQHDLDSFYIQGYTSAVKMTDEGLMVETPNVPIGVGQYEEQVYIWTKKPFEGDLYVEYEFKTLRKGGLSLIMVQASGMQREDFMADYPLRMAGNMNMVAWSSVRNYHWEYYREMNDVRNDIATGAMLKNPYQYPIGFGTLDHLLSLNEWHKLQLLQTGSRIIGAIDGKVIIEGDDNGFINNGAIYSYGRIAIRCMVRTKMLFRNINVYNRNLDFEILETSR